MNDLRIEGKCDICSRQTKVRRMGIPEKPETMRPNRCITCESVVVVMFTWYQQKEWANRTIKETEQIVSNESLSKDLTAILPENGSIPDVASMEIVNYLKKFIPARVEYQKAQEILVVCQNNFPAAYQWWTWKDEDFYKKTLDNARQKDYNENVNKEYLDKMSDQASQNKNKCLPSLRDRVKKLIVRLSRRVNRKE